jgi:hypothetical protein
MHALKKNRHHVYVLPKYRHHMYVVKKYGLRMHVLPKYSLNVYNVIVMLNARNHAQVLEWMYDEGIRPGVLFYSSVVNGLAKAAERGAENAPQKVCGIIPAHYL